MKNFLKSAGLILLGGIVLWAGACAISPTVKDWTLYDVLRIERVVEDESTDDTTTDDTTEDKNNEIENEDPGCIVPPDENLDETTGE